jgi:hypothetical protein
MSWQEPGGTISKHNELSIAVDHFAGAANDQEIRFAWVHHTKER